MLLAVLGANLIKVKGPRGDDAKSWMPTIRGDVFTYYLSVRIAESVPSHSIFAMRGTGPSRANWPVGQTS
ncbi:hypothetical protein [Streptomyces sp. NPDC002159]